MAQGTRSGILREPVRAAYGEVRDALERRGRGVRRHDRAVVDLLHAEVRAGDVCVDVGAGVGLLTIAMAKLVGETGKVYAFDPHAENGPKLLANAQWCGLAERIELRIGGWCGIEIPGEQRVDLIRVDGEAETAAALNGLGETLRRWRPTLLLECRSREAWEAAAGLTTRGYTLHDARRQTVDPGAATPPAHVVATHPLRRAA